MQKAGQLVRRRLLVRPRDGMSPLARAMQARVMSKLPPPEDKAQPRRPPHTRPVSTATPTAAGARGAISEMVDWYWNALTSSHRKKLAILIGASMVSELGLGVVVPILPSMVQDLGLGATGLGLVLSAPYLARVLLNLPVGALVQRFGRVPMMVTGEIAEASAYALTAFATSLPSLLAARLLVGAASATAKGAAGVYLADVTEVPALRSRRGLVMGVQASTGSAAWIAGPAVGGLVAASIGPQATFLGVAALGSTVALAYSQLPELTKTTGSISTAPPLGTATPTPPEGQELAQGQGDGSLTHSLGNFREALEDRDMQGVLASNLVLCLNYAAMMTVIPLKADLVWTASPQDLGLIFSGMAAMGLIGGPTSGLITDRFGRKAAIIPALTVCSLATAGVGCSEGFTPFAAGLVVWGAAESLLAPAIWSLAADITGKDQNQGTRGEALGLMRQAGDSALLVGPILLGFTADTAGIGAAFGVTSVLTAAALAPALRVQELQPGTQVK